LNCGHLRKVNSTFIKGGKFFLHAPQRVHEGKYKEKDIILMHMEHEGRGKHHR